MQNLPKFHEFDVAIFKQELENLLTKNKNTINTLLNQTTFNWDNLIHPIEEMDNDLHRRWSLLTHLHNVVDNEVIRETYNACLPILSEYHSELGQNEALYQAFKRIADSSDYAEFSQTRRQIIDHAMRDFKLSGIGLNDTDKTTYRELQKKLANLTSRFEENVLDATNQWTKHITDKTLLAGMPEHALQTAEQLAKEKGLSGWILTLEFPCYYAVITYADHAELRQEIYKAYYTRASELGQDPEKHNNSQIMLDIVDTRDKLAKLLGFNNYAELSLATKMLKKPEQVLTFLNELAELAYPAAKKEFNELAQFAQTSLNAWDIAYYSEKWQKQLFDFTSEELRPYFPEPRVLHGMFDLVSTLYGISIKQIDNVETWHPDVKCFAIYDKEQQIKAYFYIDLYARPNKRGGAWMDDYCGRYRLLSGKLQLPIAFLTCNFTPPQPNQPALFTHDEVLTLFHEFGHGLHHMLTQIEELSVSGINGVEWDAVELPSQFMENFCWDKSVIKRISAHYQTGESLPDTLFEKLLASKNFQAAMQLVRQLEFALFDFHIHAEYTSGVDNSFIQKKLDDVRKLLAVVPIAPYNRFQHGFSHIFAGGYAAGYYSYKWAEVLSCDVFAKFAENGVVNAKIGQEFLHCILERGGSEDAMNLFKCFRGREPEVDALLKNCGLM